jgi:putative hydrolase of the HAD superfamily
MAGRSLAGLRVGAVRIDWPVPADQYPDHVVAELIGRTPAPKRSQAVVFDGDDTLWETEPLYDDARTKAASVAAKFGLNPAEFEAIQRAVDIDQARRMGLSSKRFPSSSVKALQEVARRAGIALPTSAFAEVYSASVTVFETPASIYPHAREVLAQLQPQYHLALLTKGDEEIQIRRVRDSGLSEFFEVVEVVGDKSADTFVGLLKELGCAAGESWSVGNSFRSDIAPALDAGLRAIWIDAYVWAHEHGHDEDSVGHPGLHIAGRLSEVPTIVARGPAS